MLRFVLLRYEDVTGGYLPRYLLYLRTPDAPLVFGELEIT